MIRLVHILTLVRWFVSIKTETVGSDAVFMRQKVVWAALGRSIIFMAILSYSFQVPRLRPTPSLFNCHFSDLPPQFLDNTEVCYNIWMECQRNSPRRPVAMVFFQILIEANSNYLQQIVPTQSTQIHCICIHWNDNHLWPRGLLLSVNMTTTF